MRLGARAKLTIAGGLIASCTFLILGVRELGRPESADEPRASTVAAPAPAPVILLAAATRPIQTGETITADMIRSAPTDPARNPTSATPAEIIGKVATRAIPAGSLIPREAVGTESKLAIRVPVGMRAVSIDTTAEIAVAGLVRPGDRVDVQVVYPGADALSGARGSGRSRARTLLQLVPVLAVGESVVGAQPASGNDATIPARTVTLALSPDQVSVLSLAKNTGALTLSLRNPADREQVQVATAASTGPDPMPQPVAIATAPPPAAAPPPKPRPHAIELRVGDRSETLYTGSAAR